MSNETSGQTTVSQQGRQPPTRIVRIREANGTLVLDYAPRRRRNGMTFLCLGVIIAVALAIPLQNAGYDISDINLFKDKPVRACFGLFALCMVSLGLYHLTNTRQVEASLHGLIGKRRLFGIATLMWQASAGEIREIRRHIIRRNGRFRLKAHLYDGRTIIVGNSLRKRAWAKHLQRRLEQMLRLKPAQMPLQTKL